MDLLDRLSIEYPVLQAGMGGGVSGADMAVAVTNAGGLGTVGFMPPNEFDHHITRTKVETMGKSYAANLLVRFTLRKHIEVIGKHKVPIVSMFSGFNAAIINAVKETGALVIYQVGSEEEAEKVVTAGADALIVQGFEAGGHVRGKERLASILPKIRSRYPNMPIIAAGGIYDSRSAASAMAMRADGVASGTRFLMTNESGAHDIYKNLLVEGSETIVTTLFGLGWPEPHRVLVGDAIKRWCDESGEPLFGIRAVNWLMQFGAKYIPQAMLVKMTQLQRVNRPFFTPMLISDQMDDRPINVWAAYAGECVNEIHNIDSAASVLKSLSEGC